MKDMCSVNAIGRLTRDAVSKEVGNTHCLEIGIAVNRSVKKGDEWKDEVSYFEVSYFCKNDTKILPLLSKGKQIGISGTLIQERWEKDGKKQSAVKIKADDIFLLGGKDEKSETKSNQSSNLSSSIDNFPDDVPF